MDHATDNMVLRTLYLPKDLDQTLKAAAVRGGRSKGDVIRELIQAGLNTLEREPGSYLASPAPRNSGPLGPKVVKGRAAAEAKSRTPSGKSKSKGTAGRRRTSASGRFRRKDGT